MAAAAAKRLRVLCVCLGNICRSPLAHVQMEDAVRKAGLHGRVEVDSCGTAGYHIGDGADPRSAATAREHGLDLGRHRGRQLNPRKDFDEFDLILCMDDSNLRDVLKARGKRQDTRAEVRKMLEFASDPKRRNASVPDPYYGGDDGFERVFEMLDDACPRALAYLVEKHGLSK